MLAGSATRAAALAAALTLALASCTGGSPDGHTLTAEFTGGGEGPPTAQPVSPCPVPLDSASAAVYGTTLAGFGFVRADGEGLLGRDGREAVGRSAVTRHGAQLRITENVQDLASVGRALLALYDAGRVFAIDTASCRESARRDLRPDDLGVPGESDLLWDGFARSAGPTRRALVYGRYSPPGRSTYSGFVAELDANLAVGRTERYDALILDVWTDDHGDPLVLLDDGSVRAVGQREPVVRPTYRHARDASSVSRSAAGIWISGGSDGPNYLRLPSGRVTALPTGSFSTGVVAHDDQAVVLLPPRAEVRFVTAGGRHTTVPVGRGPNDALTIGTAVLVVGYDDDTATLIEWRRRTVVARYAVGPQPARFGAARMNGLPELL